MKTQKLIRQEIDEIERQMRDKDITKGILNSLKSKREKLQLCITYLSHNPTADFLKKEIDRIENRLKRIDEDIDKMINPNAYPEVQKKIRNGLEKEYNVRHLKQQLSTLKYLYA